MGFISRGAETANSTTSNIRGTMENIDYFKGKKKKNKTIEELIEESANKKDMMYRIGKDGRMK